MKPIETKSEYSDYVDKKSKIALMLFGLVD